MYWVKRVLFKSNKSCNQMVLSFSSRQGGEGSGLGEKERNHLEPPCPPLQLLCTHRFLLIYAFPQKLHFLYTFLHGDLTKNNSILGEKKTSLMGFLISLIRAFEENRSAYK